jgi:hypothetical protein
MILESLTIERATYDHTYDGRNIKKGDYKGTIKFISDNGHIQLSLRPDHVAPIMAIVADSLIDVSRVVAQQLTSEIFNTQSQLIEHEVAVPAPVQIDDDNLPF